MNPLAAILSALGTFASGFFKTKQEAMQTTLAAIKDLSASDQSLTQAASAVLVAEAQSESKITSSWRSYVAVGLAGLYGISLLLFIFGYAPKSFYSPLPPVVELLHDDLVLCLSGYMGFRTIEKVIKSAVLPFVIKALQGVK